ncbi:MAG: polyamine aminopropyltransferase [Proteobacteria bacterium]|nr:polyamine aminopropyltransferase [Pseudomonadota bacterium]
MKHPSFHVPLAPDVSLAFKPKAQLIERRSAYQRITIEHTSTFGHLYRLDDDLMASEADEFIVHESLAHIPALAHPSPRSALILGGGDGATARELLKHPSLERIVVAELDPEVVRLVGQFIPALPARSFDSPRVCLQIRDAAKSLRQLHARGERFDLILFDLTATDDPACAHLHHEEFMRLCAASLNAGGIIHVQLGSPFYQAEKTIALWQRMRGIFAGLRPAFISVPSYGGPWLLARASISTIDDPSSAGLHARLAERGITDLRHYNPDLHHACQVLPNHLRQLLA